MLACFWMGAVAVERMGRMSLKSLKEQLERCLARFGSDGLRAREAGEKCASGWCRCESAVSERESDGEIWGK